MTTGASSTGANPSMTADPHSIGTPATAMLSFSPTSSPESGPSAVGSTSQTVAIEL